MKVIIVKNTSDEIECVVPVNEDSWSSALNRMKIANTADLFTISVHGFDAASNAIDFIESYTREHLAEVEADLRRNA